MYTSINILEVAGFHPPVPIFLPLVGETVFWGDFITKRTVAVDERFPYFQFKVGQIVDKMSETDITVNCFATEEQCIRAHLPGTPELKQTSMRSARPMNSFHWPTLITLRKSQTC
jgi:hypothetical protein